jgi:hypothetical protein
MQFDEKDLKKCYSAQRQGEPEVLEYDDTNNEGSGG